MDRPPAAIGEGLEPLCLVAAENFIAGLSGYPARPAHIAHRLAIQKPGDKPQALVHDRTLLPRHRHPPPKWRKVLPMCPVRFVTYVSGRSAQCFSIFKT